MNIYDGGQAFPALDFQHLKGMSLRDYFAGQALAGLLTSTATDGDDWDTIAAKAYDSADAMLAARERREP